MTVIYADTVFVLNTALDYLLLRSAARLTAVPIHPLRLLGGAALGGGYAAAVFLPSLGWLTHPLLRLTVPLVMTALALGTGRGLVRRWAVFCGLSGALAGGLVMVSLMGTKPLGFPRGIPVSLPDAKALLLAGALCYWLCATLLSRLAPATGGELLPVKLYWQGRTVSLTVLRDTGNLLTDCHGAPILVTDRETLSPLLPPALRSLDAGDPVGCLGEWGGEYGNRLGLVRCRSAGAASAMLLTLRTDRAEIGTHTVTGQVVAISPSTMAGEGYRGVIGVSSITTPQGR